MKLKKLTLNADDRLSKFIEYMNNITFDEYGSKEKYIVNIDKNGCYINSFKPELEKDIKNKIIELVTKYWKDFEAGIDFHKYDNNEYFIEIKQEPGNIYVFTIESLDDDFYCKFNSNFIVNL